MKVAVVGCGGMGQWHAQSYAKMPGVELVGVCDQVMEYAEDTAVKVGAPAFGAFEEMLAAVAFDVVSVAVPTFVHKEVVLQAARAGKHVICEKPVALHLEDAQEMISCCEENEVRLFIGHVVRFFPEYAQMKQQIDDGHIGKVGVANARRVGGHPGEARPWFMDADKSGGVIVDLMVHDIDFMRWTLGEVKSVYGMNKCEGSLDYALVTLVFEGGAVANLEAFWGYPGSFRYAAEFAGSEGLVRTDSMSAKSLQIRKTIPMESGGKVVEIPQSPNFYDPYYIELEHFLTCIREGSDPIVTVHDACKALEIAKAALESIRTGKVVLL
ncbi:Gfo/Idh/MocA family protein [Paenibacillus aceris]|uniref:Dehydrogenase n=1 Tax=Paenibacillus aceris TaxID=869555 RepID=A0ABS4HVT8_9BACL|nr:Gfo/Idh/MocA family oxidoreductase [Paenibacillus aceris]MBP1962762.1 putative dehydrogenase [Paenibacillus aceris]NHW33875.1 Gfo/Idh/MocA family oxidoreductase [Paenibacillus aceris]